MNQKIKVKVVGATGYGGLGIIDLLLRHPCAEISALVAREDAGKRISDVYPHLAGFCDLPIYAADDPAVQGAYDVVFFSTPDRVGMADAKAELAKGAKVIDYSGDFRFTTLAAYQDYATRLGKDPQHLSPELLGTNVYGMPELHRSEISRANLVGNPGCFATAIQLSLIPMAAMDRLPEIHVTGITGSAGAGQAPSETTHFSWRTDNLSIYKAFTHQHLGEVNETLKTLAPSYTGEMNFVPVRGDFARGILASVYFDCDLPEEAAVQIYRDYYRDKPFVHVIDTNPDLKMVVNTNKCVLNVRKHGRKLHVISVIDNLVKGASGQAVQNMNLIFGLPEDTGLHLKATRF